MTEPEKRLLVALAWMCQQYLKKGDRVDHECMGAGQAAVELLIEYGLLTPAPRGGTWTKTGLTFLELN